MQQDKKLYVSKKGYELIQLLFKRSLLGAYRIYANSEGKVDVKDSEELLCYDTNRTRQPYRYGDSFISSRNGCPQSVGQLIKLDQGYLVLLGEYDGRVLTAKFGTISKRIEGNLTMNDVDDKDFRGFWIFHEVQLDQYFR